MRTLTLKDVNWKNFWSVIKNGDLPLPKSVIPPERDHYIDFSSPLSSHGFDYPGKLLDESRKAVKKCVEKWNKASPIGVWISGGVDSSLLLYLLCDIVGSENVKAYTLTFDSHSELGLAESIVDFCDVKLITERLTVEKGISLIEEAVISQRSPIDSVVVPFISRICANDGTSKNLSAIGLDETQGAYLKHVEASDVNYSRVELETLMRCQNYYLWINLYQSRKYVDVQFPFLDPDFISFSRSLPKRDKCQGNGTKIRLRKEMSKIKGFPIPNIYAGYIVGTKKGFTPILKTWFDLGLDEWCNDNISPPYYMPLRERLFVYHPSLRRNLWKKFRLATGYVFLKNVHEGRFKMEVK